MSIFPTCNFDLRVPDERIIAGVPTTLTLVVEAPSPIPRAERILCAFRSRGWIGLARDSPSLWEVFYEAKLDVELPASGLAAGTRELSLELALPEWLPPAFDVVTCGIVHEVVASVDVGWAVDPTARFAPTVVAGPRTSGGVRTPVATRTPPSFHEAFALEISLASSVLLEDERLEGAIALRAGRDAPIDALSIELVSRYTTTTLGVPSAYDEQRANVFIASEKLRGGRPVPFAFDARSLAVAFDYRVVRHQMILVFSADVVRGSSRSFELPLEVLPAGTPLGGVAARAVVGTERLRGLSDALAMEPGLRTADPPALAEGTFGRVRLRLVDVAEGARFGVAVELSYPELSLGLSLRRRRAEGRRARAALASAPVAEGHTLEVEADWARTEDAERALGPFLHAALEGLHPDWSDVHLSDHALRYFVDASSADAVVAAARAARDRANALGRAIPRLPFRGPASARAAWEATAAERGASLLPTGPTLSGLSFGARTLTGGERVVHVEIRSPGSGDAMHVRVDVSLDAPLPEAARALLESGSPHELLTPVRATFSSASAREREIVLTTDAWTPDPRALFPALEALLDFVLDARGERRARSAYR